MRLYILYLSAILAASSSIVSASPTLFSRQDESCGKSCWTDDDCSGTCHWCSQPAQWRWQCVDFNPNPPPTTTATSTP
ncbi:hypothetical protein F5Y04DRAFT_143595 [Hypomontagnella monticulosa]|nr:hypothetical protein F5Y04DRAFT_143595 [Hypomontagnella monticulosa]